MVIGSILVSAGALLLSGVDPATCSVYPSPISPEPDISCIDFGESRRDCENHFSNVENPDDYIVAGPQPLNYVVADEGVSLEWSCHQQACAGFRVQLYGPFNCKSSEDCEHDYCWEYPEGCRKDIMADASATMALLEPEYINDHMQNYSFYYWKVVCLNGNGQVQSTSSLARFSTGTVECSIDPNFTKTPLNIPTASGYGLGALAIFILLAAMAVLRKRGSVT